MSLNEAFRRLSFQPSSICQQCRRTFTSTTAARQPQSATRAFSDSLQSSTSTRQPPQYGTQRSPSPASIPPMTGPSSNPNPPSSYDIAAAAIRDSTARTREKREEERAADLARGLNRQEMERQMHRKFKAGDVYAPHDLTGVEMAKWKKVRRKGRQKYDVLDQLGIDPREHYRNFSVMSEYMSDMGRIKHNRETGLRPRNQRRMAKAIRRAIGIGLMPGVHRHPEILRLEMQQRSSLL